MATFTSAALNHLFKTGEYSDLTLRTQMKDFLVHKCIVCPKWKLLKERCTRQSKDIGKALIELEEDESVVGCVVRHLYERGITLTFGVDKATPDNAVEVFERYVNFWKATHKYGIDSAPQIGMVASQALHLVDDPVELTRLCSLCHASDMPEDLYIRGAAAKLTLDAIDRIREDQTGWDELYGNERYVDALLKYKQRQQSLVPAKRKREAEAQEDDEAEDEDASDLDHIGGEKVPRRR